ncbi:MULTISPECIES: MarR family winged helix-turn-helix transcriptional regulator [unclassified Crossiella]|uniref:MarR family winged helix-turn-helix transcriptional regulator n=1 Tax=unclassified Crossiella TaxID=2620835 RepID=UPI001FFF8E49|nr:MULTISPECIES: MarR family transcriptional regulator [unclassified Crossiella]MCK2243983.1 MarR family transcriptional regulator [Crossiella sp. S99.2]MCK2257159.1 MarR family transcriptional regulator [Crossiella sp. S99.1]
MTKQARPELILDSQLCFSLYAASRAVTALYRPMLDELGLTYPQYLVLLVLWERGPVSVKDLGDALHLDSGTLSPLLKRMESAGLLRRRRSEEDERSVLVEPTETGRDLRARALDIPERLTCGMGLPLDELTELHTRLRRLNDSMTAVRQKEGQ